MKILTRLLALSLLFPLLRAAAPVPFAALLEKADSVVLAKIAYGDSNSEAASGQRAQLSRRCKLTLQVSNVLKGGSVNDGSAAAGLAVTYGAPTEDECATPRSAIDVPTGNTALWLLRVERGATRVVGGGAPAVFALNRELLPTEQRDLAEWVRPEMRVAYLFVKPGIVLSAEKYSFSTLPIQMVDVLGWPDFLTVFRRAFEGAGGYERDQMSLVAASFNHCVEMAHRVLGNTASSRASIPAEPTTEASRREEETLLRWMSWTNRADLIRALKTPEAATRELVRWGCSSFPRVKTRARTLLAQYFGIDPASLPCLPCD